MPQQRFEITRSITTPARREAVMDLILQPGTWSRWQQEITSALGPAKLAPGDVVDGRAEMLGFEVDGQSVTTEVGEDTYSQQVVVGVGMQIRYEVKQGPSGTVITHTLVSQLPQGALGRVLSFFLARRLKKMQRELLRNLAVQAEASSG